MSQWPPPDQNQKLEGLCYPQDTHGVSQKLSAIPVWPAKANIHLYTYIHIYVFEQRRALLYRSIPLYSFNPFLNVKSFLWKGYLLHDDDCDKDNNGKIIRNPAKFRALYFHQQNQNFLNLKILLCWIFIIAITINCIK